VFVGSVVDTVTTFELLLILNIGTGVVLFGGEIAVSDEIVALCGKASGVNTDANADANTNTVQSWKNRLMRASTE